MVDRHYDEARVKLLRHLLSILLLPVMVAAVLPRWILANGAAIDTRWPLSFATVPPRTLGVLVLSFRR